MTPSRRHRPEITAITAAVANLRQTPARLRRQSRQIIESTVSQLLDAAVHYPPPSAASGEYRIEELAQLAGTTTRNIRVYRDRDLLHPPLRSGRVALYNDTHLTRLRLITSMLDRGYNIAHVKEMLSAWQEGKSLGDVLGLETALTGAWTTERPETMPRIDAERLIDDQQAFERLAALGVICTDGAQATITRPKLIEALNEMRGYGISMTALVDLHERIVPHIDAISELLVQAGAGHVTDRIKPGAPLPADTEIAELITMLVRLRTQALASVTATLASSIDHNIKAMATQILAEQIHHAPDAETTLKEEVP